MLRSLKRVELRETLYMIIQRRHSMIHICFKSIIYAHMISQFILAYTM